MRWKNTETPSFAGVGGSKPAVIESMQLLDRDGTEVAKFEKAVTGVTSMTVDGSPVGGGGALTLATVTVDATVATKQDFLAAVGASTNQVPVDIIVRNASQSLEGITGGNGFSVGYDAGATDVVAGENVGNVATSDQALACTLTALKATGVNGDILGCIVDPVLPLPMVVAGAATSAANGTYGYIGLNNSKAAYKIGGTNHVIDWDGIDRWRIQDSDTTFYYYSLDDVATPDLCTTWVADVDGSNPVPTVTEGANPTFDVDVLYYDVAI